MPNTSRMQWPYPAQDSDPWFVKFEEMVAAMDLTGSAAREDRHLILAKGGYFTWTLSTKTLSWTDTLEIISPLFGFRNDVVANNVSLDEGDFLYVNLQRFLVGNTIVAPVVAETVPYTDAAYALCTRRDDEIYFRNGERLLDGQTRSLFGPRFGTAGQKEIDSLNIANRVTGTSNTPFAVGAMSFNPLDHDRAGMSQSLYFRAVASNGDSPLLTHVKLVNVTDAEDVATLDFTSTALTKQETSLVRGTGPGQIADSPHIYEVQIYLDVAPGDPSETIELYSVEIRVVNTIV